MKKPLKIGLIIGGGFLSLLVILVLAVIVLLNTSYIEKKILPKVLTSLKDNGIVIQYDSLRPKWLSSIYVDDVSVVIDDIKGVKADLKIEKLGIKYSFFRLLRKKLYVEELFIANPILESTLSIKKLSAQDKEEKPRSINEIVEEAIDSFPLSALYSNIRITGAKAGITETDNDMRLDIVAGNMLLEPDIRLKGKSVFLNLAMHFTDEDNLVEFRKGKDFLSFKPSLEVSFSGTLLKRFGGYEFDAPVIDIKSSGKALKFRIEEKDAFSVDDISVSIKGSADSEKIDSNLKVKVSGMAMPMVKKPVELSSDITMNVGIKEREFALDGKTSIGEFDALGFDGVIYDSSQKLEGDLRIRLAYTELLREKFKGLDSIPAKRIGLDNHLIFSLRHGASSIFEVSEPQKLIDHTFVQIEGKVSCDELLDGDASVKCPGNFKSIVSTEGEKLSLSVENGFSQLFSEYFQATGMNAYLEIEMPFHLEELRQKILPDNMNINARFNADYLDSYYFERKIKRSDIPVLSSKWKASLNASINNKREELSFNANVENKNKNLAFDIDVKSDFALNNTLVQGRGGFKPYFPETSESSAAGSVSFPFKIVTVDRKTFDLSSELVFEDMSLSNSLVTVNGMKGRVPIREKVRLQKGSKVSFVNIYTESPFNRADYIAVNPYLAVDRRFALKIDRVKRDTIEIGPAYTDLMLDQNMLKAEHFYVKLFDGDLDGNFFFDLRKGKERIGFIGKLTGIKPRMILNQDASEDKGAKKVSGQMDVIYDINSSFVSGRMDINEIGSQQLIDLVNAVDPMWENSSLVSLRKALKIAYPTYVGMSMDRGYFDLKVRMPVLALIKGKGELDFKGLPLTPIVSIYSEELKEAVSSSPIK